MAVRSKHIIYIMCPIHTEELVFALLSDDDGDDSEKS